MRCRRISGGVPALAALALTMVPGRLTGQSPPGRTVWDSVYTEQQARRGEQLYLRECAVCHGAQLGGMDAAPALTGGAFRSRWNGVTLADMAERIRVSMPLSDPGKLSRQQVADALSYILSVNQFPAGTSELPRQSGFLQGVVFQAFPPER